MGDLFLIFKLNTLTPKMSDTEQQQEVEQVEQVEEEVKVDKIEVAIKIVLKTAKAFSGTVQGLNEVVKTVDRKNAHLVVLAEDCSDPKYTKLVQALCKQQQIPIVPVPSRQELGQCKHDKAGVARMIRGYSSVAIKDWGEETEALSFVQNWLKEQQA